MNADAPADVDAAYFDEAEDVSVEVIELIDAEAVVDRPRPSSSRFRFTSEDERLSACERALRYAFRDRTLLVKALTHSSSTSDKRQDNERLEFFGDAVLDLVVREYLYHNYPNHQEGDLTEAKSAVVCRSSLVKAAGRLGLGGCLLLGRGVGKRRSVPESLLADAFEAVVAAIYLDGGYAAVRDFILRSLGDEIPHSIERANAANYKSNLQKIIQQNRRPLPIYRVLGSSGPEHSRVFQVAVLLDGKEMGRGSGASKKSAEQEAARAALARLDIEAD